MHSRMICMSPRRWPDRAAHRPVAAARRQHACGIETKLSPGGAQEIIHDHGIRRRSGKQINKSMAQCTFRYFQIHHSALVKRDPVTRRLPDNQRPPAEWMSGGRYGAKRSQCSTPFCRTATGAPVARKPVQRLRRTRHIIGLGSHQDPLIGDGTGIGRDPRRADQDWPVRVDQSPASGCRTHRITSCRPDCSSSAATTLPIAPLRQLPL